MADLLVDSDVFIDHLRGARALCPRRDRIRYSVLTRCELFAGPASRGRRPPGPLPLEEVDLNGTIAERAGKIRRQWGTSIFLERRAPCPTA